MVRIPKSRLIEASASLDPAGRALLDLWMTRGLSDAAIGAMAGLAPEEVSARKREIVARLGRELGVPPEDVRAALIETTAEPDAPAPRRRGAILGALGLLIVAAVVVVLVLSLGSSHPRRRSATHPRAQTSLGASVPLRVLSLDAPDAGGTVRLVHDGSERRLELTIRGLPVTSAGHYEAWLYTTIIDSRPLGSVPAGSSHVTLTLPPGAGAYAEIDVALESTGSHYDSGESVLRAPNPAA